MPGMPFFTQFPLEAPLATAREGDSTSGGAVWTTCRVEVWCAFTQKSLEGVEKFDVIIDLALLLFRISNDSRQTYLPNTALARRSKAADTAHVFLGAV